MYRRFTSNDWKETRRLNTEQRRNQFPDFEVEHYHDLEIQTWTSYCAGKDRPFACIYKGKAGKPISSYWFRSTERRTMHIDYHKREADDRERYRQEKKQAAENFENPFKIGDVFYNSWGYEQTNIDYYEVVKVTAKTVTVRQIGKKNVSSTGWAQGTCEPNPGHFLADSKPLVKHVKVYTWNGKPEYSIGFEFGGASLYDGRPNHWTAYH